MGFDIPYSAGFGVNYIHQESKLAIENLYIGFNNSTMQNIDEIVRFNDAVSTSTAINFRPDIWILPFLNIYGIFAKSNSSTLVDFSVWLPTKIGSTTEPEWNEVFTMETKAEFSATTFGFGLPPTIGVGGGWMAFDMNFTWSDIDELDKPAYVFVFGPRIGKSFNFKKPDQNVSVWVGAFRVKIGAQTNGSLVISDIVDFSEFNSKIETGIVKLNEAQTQVDNCGEILVRYKKQILQILPNILLLIKCWKERAFF